MPIQHKLALLNTLCTYKCHMKKKLLTYLLTYSMQQSQSSEANRFSASQEISHILRNLEVHYHVHMSPPPVPIMSQNNPVHAAPPHLTSWRSILPSHLCLGLPSGLFPSGFPTKTLYALLLSPIPATCPGHLILPDLMYWWGIQIIKLTI